MIEKGRLVYKCRRCGKLNKNTQVPDGLYALNSILNKIPLPEEWGGFILTETDICSCDDGNLGISDLIGFEKDKI